MDYIVTRDDSEALQHFGIKGMKWGVRNAETEARYSRKRRGSGFNKVATRLTGLNKKQRAQNRKVKNERRKLVAARRLIDDKDLQKAYERVDLERKYKELVTSDIQPGRTALKKALAKSGDKILTAAVTAGATAAITYAATKYAKEKPNSVDIVKQVAGDTRKLVVKK